MRTEVGDQGVEVVEQEVVRRPDAVVPRFGVADLEITSKIDCFVVVSNKGGTLEVDGVRDLVNPRFDFGGGTSEDEGFLEPWSTSWITRRWSSMSRSGWRRSLRRNRGSKDAVGERLDSLTYVVLGGADTVKMVTQSKDSIEDTLPFLLWSDSIRHGDGVGR